MAEILAFRGLRYDQTKVALKDVVAPPYDVISLSYQNELYDRDPYNVIRLILGRSSDRYQEAAMCLGQWREAGILTRDQEPAVYVLAQRFESPNIQTERIGFIAACRLEEFGTGIILPHEKTHSKPKADRLSLMQSTHTNFSQIFALYSDLSGDVEQTLRTTMESPPILDVKFEGVDNRLWRLSDSSSISQIGRTLDDTPVLIADGHHRYETALAYRDLMRLRKKGISGKEPFNYTMMFFADMSSGGLVILPTHRLIHGLPEFDETAFVHQLDQEFSIQRESSESNLVSSLAASGPFSFGLVTPGLRAIIHLKRRESVAQLIPGVPDQVRELDVALLHLYVLEQLLGISSSAQEMKANLEYVKETDEAFDAVRRGNAQIAFLMNPTKIEQVRSIAQAGHTMPQKSTFFYPKLVTGLVMNSLEEE